jgi:hypothetical protein
MTRSKGFQFGVNENRASRLQAKIRRGCQTSGSFNQSFQYSITPALHYSFDADSMAAEESTQKPLVAKTADVPPDIGSMSDEQLLQMRICDLKAQNPGHRARVAHREILRGTRCKKYCGQTAVLSRRRVVLS